MSGHNHGHSHGGHACTSEHHSHGGGGGCDHGQGDDDKDMVDALQGGGLNGLIDFKRVRCLNVADPEMLCRMLQKPWEERRSEAVCAASDADEEMIIYVPFTEVVKVRAICVVGGTRAEEEADAPSTVRLFANRDDLDFENAAGITPDQQLDLQKGQYGDMEHQLRQSKFSSVRELTLHVDKNFGADVTRVSFIHFRGAGSKISTEKKVVTTVYETTGQLSDHKVFGAETMQQGL
eukprot:TRINITY_DN16959_c0_g1_i1.p1 TRINITY_DN16959_c0_g1~~TRINITY_DN16959_c0_g1_i1.p1  ORF type:complete len:235 (+),score=64.48 TRINITY_DN16959_c0_g1_i1:81-785(+)